MLRSKFFTPEQVKAIVQDYHNAGLAPAEVAVMEFAEKVTRNAYKITTEDIAALRSHGYSDENILDITLTVGARNFFSKVLDALGVEPDEEYRKMEEPLQHALDVEQRLTPDLSNDQK